MKKSTKVILGATVAFLLAFAFFGVQRWATSRASSLEEMLHLLVQDMSGDTTAIVYVDVAQMRQAPFSQKIFNWAQKPQTDAEYTQFVSETGFNYERDLDRIAASMTRRGSESVWFAIAAGSFDQKKIVAYLAKSGKLQKRDGYDIYTVVSPAGTATGAGAPTAAAAPATSSTPVPALNSPPKTTASSKQPSKISVAFLRDGRIAATNDTDLSVYLDRKDPNADASQWQARFTRLAGSPVFVVVRQDASTVKAFADQAPGGLQSPQLSGLMSQLTWLTVALQPQQDSMRIVAEGESPNATATKQLADMLNGLLLLARAGLGDAKLTQQLKPATRAAFVSLLNSADVSSLDREDLKAVRIVLEITPELLNAASAAKTEAATPAGSPPAQPSPGKAPN